MWGTPQFCSSAGIYTGRAFTQIPYSRETRIDNMSWLPAKGDHVDTSDHAQLAFFDYPNWGFYMLLLSVVRQIPAYNMQKWGTAHTLP
jgi:hypothetical protein